jgi:osomolarity two-component system sensor histidine kinase TcsA
MAGNMASQILELTPVPSIVLDPSLRIFSMSNSFSARTELSSGLCVDADYLAHLEAGGAVGPGNDLRLIRDTIDTAIRTRAVRSFQHVVLGEATARPVRVVPIFDASTLLCLVLEWQEPAEQKVLDGGSLDGGLSLDNGLSTSQAFRILVETVKDYAIFLLDTKGHIMTWNAGAELNKQYTSDEIVGKHFSIFYGKEDLEAEKPRLELEICLREGRVEDEGWRYRKDGSRFWANVLITAVYDKGVHIGFGKVTRDLTERKSAESRLIAAFEETSKLKSDFLANMSHEIRTPMHGMLSACTLLFDTSLTDEQGELAGIIEDSGQILVQVINDILDYSKLTSDGFSLSSETMDPAHIIGAVIRSFQPTLKPGVHFELDLSPGLPKSVRGDPLRYRQVIQNIVSNAAKFTDKGFIRVHSSVQAEEDAESCYIMTEITDTGIGVPASAENTLFLPFTQFDDTSTKSYQGTGLGLSISKSIVELMGGQIGSRPNPDGQGSVFWFTAKFDKIKAEEHSSALATQLAATRLSTPSVDLDARSREVFQTKTLLLAEDNIINQRVMLKMLRSLGFERIDTAVDGVQATQLAVENPDTYDLILMDVSMPLVDGIAATTEIRRCGNHVPIIAVTANVVKGNREEYLQRGCTDYIAKPVDRLVLTEVLRKWLLDSS